MIIPTVKKICLITLILGQFTGPGFAYSIGLETDWNEYSSDHFFIYSHRSISHKYIRDFTRRCEQYYYLIAERLGFSRLDFWLQEEKVNIFVYQDLQDYRQGIGRRSPKSICTFYFDKDFFKKTFPHQLSRTVLTEFIGENLTVPVWFIEGVAGVNEKDSYIKYLSVVKGKLAAQGQLSVAEIENITKPKAEYSDVFSATSASIVIFLLENYHKDYFAHFCRSLREGEAFYRAMQKIYQIRDAEDLNEKFLTFLNSKSYEDIANQEELGLR